MAKKTAGGFYKLLYKDNITEKEKSQAVNKLFQKLEKKKTSNIEIIQYLRKTRATARAEKVQACATYIGVTEENGYPQIAQADFCRDRLCQVCAWRRQAKFLAQANPIIASLEQDGYKFLFCTLTIKNCKPSKTQEAITRLLQGYDRLRDIRKIKKAWHGMLRSVELSYNADTKTIHPHIHILIAVKKDYFSLQYIDISTLCTMWKEAANLDYMPICDIRKVWTNTGEAVETIKYALKPNLYYEALQAFDSLKGRRLISFSGVFAQRRKELRLNNQDNLLDTTSKKFILYKFDSTGGLYKFYKSFEEV